MDKPTFIGMIFAAALVSALTTVGYNAFVSGGDGRHMSVAIISVAELVDRAENDSERDLSPEDTLELVRKASERMVAEGYVVLEQSAVLGAPNGYKVNTDRIMALLDEGEGAPEE